MIPKRELYVFYGDRSTHRVTSVVPSRYCAPESRRNRLSVPRVADSTVGL